MMDYHYHARDQYGLLCSIKKHVVSGSSAGVLNKTEKQKIYSVCHKRE